MAWLLSALVRFDSFLLVATLLATHAAVRFADEAPGRSTPVWAALYQIALPLFADLDFNVVSEGVWATFTWSFGQAVAVGNPDRSQINAVGWYLRDRGNGSSISAHWGGPGVCAPPCWCPICPVIRPCPCR